MILQLCRGEVPEYNRQPGEYPDVEEKICCRFWWILWQTLNNPLNIKGL
jgi:hypothetical protein